MEPQQQRNPDDVLLNINHALQNLQNDYKHLLKVVKNNEGRRNDSSPVSPSYHSSGDNKAIFNESSQNLASSAANADSTSNSSFLATGSASKTTAPEHTHDVDVVSLPHSPRTAVPGATSRIILTTYPSQAGIDPIAMNWGNESPTQRGPVVVSRSQSTLRRRNG